MFPDGIPNDIFIVCRRQAFLDIERIAPRSNDLIVDGLHAFLQIVAAFGGFLSGTDFVIVEQIILAHIGSVSYTHLTLPTLEV